MVAACDSSDDDSNVLIERWSDVDQSEEQSAFLLALVDMALSNDPLAFHFLSQIYAYDFDLISIEERDQIKSILLSDAGSATAASFAVREHAGEPDLQELYDLSMSALDQCYLRPDYLSSLYNPPVFSPADFFSIAWNDVNQLSQGMEKLRICADYYFESKWL